MAWTHLPTKWSGVRTAWQKVDVRAERFYGDFLYEIAYKDGVAKTVKVLSVQASGKTAEVAKAKILSNKSGAFYFQYDISSESDKYGNVWTVYFNSLVDSILVKRDEYGQLKLKTDEQEKMNVLLYLDTRRLAEKQ
jgi:hypothetical protein